MTQNPIHKVLSTLFTHRLRALLMGGQACILYGAAEFSRDTDIALHATPDNIELLQTALRDLQARRIALPPFDRIFLEKGHAIHFRCYHADALRIRIDVISVMRGVDDFDKLWTRRTPFTLPTGETIYLMSLPDLVRSKKTQRDKDWPMIRRLIEADYVKSKNPESDKVNFWLRESRTPRMLIELAQNFPTETESLTSTRPALIHALEGKEKPLENELESEQREERETDRQYWEPLFRELEYLRRSGYDTEEVV